MAFVYLLGDSGQDNAFKIGVTRGSIEKRIKKLQTGNGESIYLADYYETERPFLIEKMMHLKYIGNRKRDEWFELDVENIVSFKEDCKRFEENFDAISDNPFFKDEKNK